MGNTELDDYLKTIKYSKNPRTLDEMDYTDIQWTDMKIGKL